MARGRRIIKDLPYRGVAFLIVARAIKLKDLSKDPKEALSKFKPKPADYGEAV